MVVDPHGRAAAEHGATTDDRGGILSAAHRFRAHVEGSVQQLLGSVGERDMSDRRRPVGRAGDGATYDAVGRTEVQSMAHDEFFGEIGGPGEMGACCCGERLLVDLQGPSDLGGKGDDYV